MDNETKNILKILGVAIVILLVFKPKSNSSNGKSKLFSDEGNKVKPPKTDSGNPDQEFENAVLSIKAYRSALNNNEPQSELDKLNRITISDYGIKVFNKDGKLYARNTKGEDVANEK